MLFGVLFLNGLTATNCRFACIEGIIRFNMNGIIHAPVPGDRRCTVLLDDTRTSRKFLVGLLAAAARCNRQFA